MLKKNSFFVALVLILVFLKTNATPLITPASPPTVAKSVSPKMALALDLMEKIGISKEIDKSIKLAEINLPGRIDLVTNRIKDVKIKEAFKKKALENYGLQVKDIKAEIASNISTVLTELFSEAELKYFLTIYKYPVNSKLLLFFMSEKYSSLTTLAHAKISQSIIQSKKEFGLK